MKISFRKFSIPALACLLCIAATSFTLLSSFRSKPAEQANEVLVIGIHLEGIHYVLTTYYPGKEPEAIQMKNNTGDIETKMQEAIQKAYGQGWKLDGAAGSYPIEQLIFSKR